MWLIRWSGEKGKGSKYILEYRAIEKALAKWQALFDAYEYALRRPDLKDKFLEYLKGLVE